MGLKSTHLHEVIRAVNKSKESIRNKVKIDFDILFPGWNRYMTHLWSLVWDNVVYRENIRQALW
jgi:hypothetical protein